MENEQEPNEKDLPKHTIEQLQKATAEESRRKQWRAEIESNAALQEYFKQFTAESVKSFIDTLLLYKNIWANYGPMYVDKMETSGIYWVNKASEHLAFIQQKKLFDIQCLWRAEQTKIEGIDICYEFVLWEDNILNCPFVEPVSREDIDLYSKFLLQGDVNIEYSWYCRWQDYTGIKEAYHSDTASRSFPEWYDYYNLYRGTTALMSLPDVRGEKENFYKNLLIESNRDIYDAQRLESEQYRQNNKSLFYYDTEQLSFYMSTFENKETQHYFKAYEWWRRNSEIRETLDLDIELLFSQDELIPIEANVDWREGVRIAANKHRLRKIAEALPEAWEQYMINIQTGISFPVDSALFEKYDKVKNTHVQFIIEGRIANGEPGDLNY